MHLLGRSLSKGLLDTPPLQLYATHGTLKHADETFLRERVGYRLLDPKTEKDLHIKINPIEPFKTFTAGPYRVTAFPANHAKEFSAVLYAIEEGEKPAYSTAQIPTPSFDETWQRLSINWACSSTW